MTDTQTDFEGLVTDVLDYASSALHRGFGDDFSIHTTEVVSDTGGKLIQFEGYHETYGEVAGEFVLRDLNWEGAWD